MLETKLNHGIQASHQARAARFISALGATLLVLSSASTSLAEESADACSAPALGFLAGSEMHVGYAVISTAIGADRISLQPNSAPPEDAFVPFEGHPDWGRVAMAVIVSAPEDGPEYLPIHHASNGAASLTVPALADYFAIYLEQSAPAGSAFADYLFHSTHGVSAGYHLVHAEAQYDCTSDEPDYVFTIVDMAQPIPNDFQPGVVPTGLNL